MELSSCLGQCLLRSPEGQVLRRDFKGDGFLVAQFFLLAVCSTHEGMTKEMFEDNCEQKELMGGGGWQGVCESHCDPEAERSEVKIMRRKDHAKPAWCL